MFRCPTCITALTDPSVRRCPACGQNLRRRRPLLLGDDTHSGSRTFLPESAQRIAARPEIDLTRPDGQERRETEIDLTRPDEPGTRSAAEIDLTRAEESETPATRDP